MPRPKGSKNKVTVTAPVDERIAAVEQEIEELIRKAGEDE